MVRKKRNKKKFKQVLNPDRWGVKYARIRTIKVHPINIEIKFNKV